MIMNTTFGEQMFVFAFKKTDVIEAVKLIEREEFSELTGVIKSKNKNGDVIYVICGKCKFHLADNHLILEVYSKDDAEVNKITGVINHVLNIIYPFLKDHSEDRIISTCEFYVDVPLDKIYTSFIDSKKLSAVGLGEIINRGLRLAIKNDRVTIILDTGRKTNRIETSKTYDFDPATKINLLEQRHSLENYSKNVLIKLGVE